jgi:hypothetical protein
MTDGFSCRTQIEQGGTGRTALHLAEVLQLARRYGPEGPPSGAPEGYVAPAPPAGGSPGRNAAAAGAGALAAAGMWALRRRR